MDGRHTAGGQIALPSRRLGGFMFDLSLALGCAAMGWLVRHTTVVQARGDLLGATGIGCMFAIG